MKSFLMCETTVSATPEECVQAQIAALKNYLGDLKEDHLGAAIKERKLHTEIGVVEQRIKALGGWLEKPARKEHCEK